ncbi:MAG: divalent-cation tolerance protein CutA [Anaerolineae bacterium]|jgi:periplasmic divalent cation tolerance protein|nr:divalent-cation tolerance protein CutA [Anaerolineae bacterium]MDH7474937.1 divalent-cation tolerance protein CutA [Anaerolineae bacterium]
MSERVVVFITAGNEEEARQIASALVGERLAACVNIIPEVHSVYRWAGTVEEGQETLLIVKSRHEVLEQLIKRVRELHSYEVPEIIALPLLAGDATYLHWLDGQVG